jgi:uncharacterized protein involved in outer membrane biogenesis
MLISKLARAGVVAHADRLDYNLATLDVRLHRVTLAATAVPETPFLTADDVHATLGWGILIGRIDVTVLEAAQSRIVLVRDEQGVANWPESNQPSAGQSLFLGLGRVDLPDLGVEWEDRRAGLHIAATDLSLHLVPNAGTTPVRCLNRPGRIHGTISARLTRSMPRS